MLHALPLDAPAACAAAVHGVPWSCVPPIQIQEQANEQENSMQFYNSGAALEGQPKEAGLFTAQTQVVGQFLLFALLSTVLALSTAKEHNDMRRKLFGTLAAEKEPSQLTSLA